MPENDQSQAAQFDVVINDEEQYSIWASSRPTPQGWRKVGKSGSKDECLEYIGTVWTDMRPASLRRQMDIKLGD